MARPTDRDLDGYRALLAERGDPGHHQGPTPLEALGPPPAEPRPPLRWGDYGPAGRRSFRLDPGEEAALHGRGTC